MIILPLLVAMSSFQSVTVTRVLDGDTIKIELPELPDIFSRMSVRLKGIDSPEIHAKRPCERRDAVLAREAVEALTTNKRVELNFCVSDKYYRLLCFVRVGPIDLSGYLLDKGLAAPYSGGKKQAWRCRS